MEKKVPHDPNEILAVVNDKDEVIGEDKRSEIHKNELIHREICVFIINEKEEVLLQKRKDLNIWDASCSGHFPKEQNYVSAAKREVEEELGITLDEKDFTQIDFRLFKAKHRVTGKINTRFTKAFIVRKNINLNEINFDKEELSEVRYFNKSELKTLVLSKENNLSTYTKFFIENYLIK